MKKDAHAAVELFPRASKCATTASKKVREVLYMSKEIDILDLLPAEAIEAVDMLGYEFLAGYGYDVEGAKNSEAKQEELCKALQKSKEELRYSGAVDDKTGAILVWYEIYKNGERVATSKGIQFLPKKEESDGENGTG